ncbi:putative phage tail protein [Paenibacillus sinopodophylli]|uniref:putative phage tail protein n=1 Tax=Paenibacillus sinopodophylli TaxID=1837342 RepID=UPI00110CBB52|nr:putative phage tail protein [Paenibacillus sinopodophylli]
MDDITSPMGLKLIDHLPDFYEEIKDFRLISQTEGEEFDALLSIVGDSFNQRFIETATWELARWEQLLGITTDVLKPYDQRRSVIKSKLIGSGTVTKAMIKAIAQAYSNGDAEVTEWGTNLSSAADIGLITATTVPVVISGAAINITAENDYVLTFDRSATNYSFGVRLRFKNASNVVITTVVTGWTYFAGYTAHYRLATAGNNTHRFTAPTGAVTVEVLHAIEANNTLYYVKKIQLERGSVATSYENLPDYTIGIKFVSSLGIPPNIEDLEAAIRAALPAHLAVQYEYTYTTFGEIAGYGVTFGAIESAGLTMGALETWEGP